MARPKPELVRSDDEHQALTRWAARPKSTPRLALRARIVLACADEPSNKAVAARLGVCSATVGTDIRSSSSSLTTSTPYCRRNLVCRFTWCWTTTGRTRHQP